MTRILFVDLDSTLVENRFSLRVLRSILEEVQVQTGESLESLGRALNAENMRRQREDPDHPQTMDWDDIAETIARERGVTLRQRVIDLWRAYASAEEVEILDDAPSMLRQMRASGWRIVLATKGLSKYQIPLLEATGMRDLFDDMLTPDLTGYLKTSPDYFTRYTSEPGNTFVHLGDHYYDDVICARRNGFLSILRAPIAELKAIHPLERPVYLGDFIDQISTYPREGSDVRPHAVVLSLQEVPTVITTLEDRRVK